MNSFDFPHYVVLKASAGSGKTHALTERFINFLISNRLPKINLKNILAITFSNNAAWEMKSRILETLKNLYIYSENREISELAERVIDEILNNYSDFQVKTIDSFMTNVFKASAYDFELDPDFEIIMNYESLMRYAFDTFLKDVGVDPEVTRLFEEMVDIIQDNVSSFLWDPAAEIYKKIKRVYEAISKSEKGKILFDQNLIDEKRRIESELAEVMEEILRKIRESNLERNLQNRIIDEFQRIIKQKRFYDLLEKGIKRCPVRKDKKFQRVYEDIESLWKEFQSLVSRYAEIYCYSYYAPYVKVFDSFYDKLQQIKRKEGKIFIEDINKLLSNHINDAYVPEIYFRIGAKIYHFFIDEFQDTSPLQWRNLKPLIENALSERGSLFIVGDTKQAIYSFRGADYRIMKEVEKGDVFPSARKYVEKLRINYRSRVKIIQFTDEFFKRTIALDEKYKLATALTGHDECEQVPHEDFKEDGYVEVKFLEDDIDLKNSLKEIIDDLQSRGYRLKDLAILASKNDQVEMLSFILSEIGISFLSYSSVDIRKRKVTSEILHLLRFLDSPLDDFSFSVFILGDIYNRVISRLESTIDLNNFIFLNRDVSPLYKAFQNEYPHLWRQHFDKLFKLTGYLPLYDLLSFAIDSFNIFENMPEEEATFIKILELAKYFEQRGSSSIKDFIELFSKPAEDETMWDMTLPIDIDAVKVMTIHKAKGLQFPVTIVFLEKERNPSDNMVIDSSKGIILKINKDVADKSEKIGEIRHNELISDTIDLLNKLYVAYTRAERELYILCRVNEKYRNVFPFSVLVDFVDKPYGIKTKQDKKQIFESVRQIVHHRSQDNNLIVSEPIHLKERERGELIHKILCLIDFIDDDVDKKIDFVVKDLGIEYSNEIREKVIGTIKNKDVNDFFLKKPDREIFNEFEICDEFGLTHRIDRLVIDADRITVIEYKTGIPSNQHISQVKLYKELISKIFLDRKVEGLIYYIDSGISSWI